MSTEIALACRNGPKVEAAAARAVCGEFMGYLRETLHGRSFQTNESGLPRIELTVTRLDTHGIGFDVAWVAADGSTRSGKPLNSTFFDRDMDATLRQRFYKTFLQQNPLPF